MPPQYQLSTEDLVEIRTLLSQGWTPQRIYEFRGANTLRGARDWKRMTIYEACKRIRARYGDIQRRHGSGRPRTVRTEENTDRVVELFQNPGSDLSTRKVALATGISRGSVRRMAQDRGLKVFKKTKVHRIPIPKRRRDSNEERRVRLSQEPLDLGERLVTHGVFVDESPFHINANLSTQNQRVYSRGKKRDVAPGRLQLKTSHLNFEEKIQVFAAISVSRFHVSSP